REQRVPLHLTHVRLQCVEASQASLVRVAVAVAVPFLGRLELFTGLAFFVCVGLVGIDDLRLGVEDLALVAEHFRLFVSARFFAGFFRASGFVGAGRLIGAA